MTPEAPPAAFLLHPAAALHDTGWGHPEHQGRLRSLASTVGRDLMALHDRVVQVEAEPAPWEVFQAVHSPELLETVREAVARAGAGGGIVELDPDTRVSGASGEAVLGSMGALLRGVEGVAKGEFSGAFVAGRPPGHHATRGRAMGFCLVNHVAAAARWLQRRGYGERVLIVDWDVHHGNGTQDIFWDDPSVFFLSLHQHPHWPGTGGADEVGVGAGAGTTLNIPVAAGTDGGTYLPLLAGALAEVRRSFSPDFVLVSSGFDALAGDPLGNLLLEPGDFHRMTLQVRALAEECCGGRVVAFLEGGYDPRRTGEGTVEVIRALAGIPSSHPAPGTEG